MALEGPYHYRQVIMVGPNAALPAISKNNKVAIQLVKKRRNHQKSSSGPFLSVINTALSSQPPDKLLRMRNSSHDQSWSRGYHVECATGMVSWNDAHARVEENPSWPASEAQMGRFSRILFIYICRTYSDSSFASQSTFMPRRPHGLPVWIWIIAVYISCKLMVPINRNFYAPVRNGCNLFIANVIF